MARTKQMARKNAQGTSRKTAAVRGKTPVVAANLKAAPGKRRTKAGVAALREIRKLQKSVNLLIQKAPMQRAVREVAQGMHKDLRFTADALAAVHTAAEAFLLDLLDDANSNAIHAKRVTLFPQDMRLAASNISKYTPLKLMSGVYGKRTTIDADRVERAAIAAATRVRRDAKRAAAIERGNKNAAAAEPEANPEAEADEQEEEAQDQEEEKEEEEEEQEQEEVEAEADQRAPRAAKVPASEAEALLNEM